MKKRGFSHIELTLILLGVLTVISIFIAAVGENQDYEAPEENYIEQTSRY